MDTHTQLSTSLQHYISSLTGRNLSAHTAIAYQTDHWRFLTWLTENDVRVTSPAKVIRTHIV